ncbi:hypothetical protein AtNW77_Chr4g0282591 [Arabidopsis thaliana]
MRMDGGDFGLWLDGRWRLEGLSCVQFSEGLGCGLRRSEESTRGDFILVILIFMSQIYISYIHNIKDLILVPFMCSAKIEFC